MENQRTFLIVALMAISAVLYTKWIEFSSSSQTFNDTPAQLSQNIGGSVPSSAQTRAITEAVPSTPSTTATASMQALPGSANQVVDSRGTIISVTTDIVIAKINTNGGVIQSIELRKEPIAIDQKDQGFPLLMKTNLETFVAQDGILVSGQTGPNHAQTLYQSQADDYSLGNADSVQVPLTWVSEGGVEYTKVFTFTRHQFRRRPHLYSARWRRSSHLYSARWRRSSHL